MFVSIRRTIAVLGGIVVLALAAFVPVSFTQSGGTITTYAGRGVCGFAGDGGLAINAQLDRPAGLATDRAGNLYIADLGNHVVRRVTPSGVITRVAGIAGATEYNGDDKRATEATLAAPAGVAVDASGRYLYIADNGHHRIRQVDLQTNRITTVAGTGTPGFSGDGGWAIQAQLSSPSAVAVDTLGNFYIADVGNRRVRRVDSSGLITTFAGTGQRLSCGDGGPAKQACFKNPVALAVGLTGEVFVADNEDHRVRRIDPSGIITTIAGNGLFNPPNPGPAKDSSVKWPQGLAINAAGNLYISDFASNIVLMLSRDGNLTLVAGTSTPGFSGDGGPATRAMLNGPSGLAVDSFGNLFISDSLNCRVRRLR